LGINRTAESQSDCKDNQWFQNGSNKKENPPDIVQNITRVSLGQSCLIFSFPGKMGKNTRSSPPASRISKLSDSQPALDVEVVNEPARFKFLTYKPT